MEEIISTIVKDLIVPIILLIGGTVMVLIQQAISKYVRNFQIKSELSNLDTIAKLRNELTTMIGTHVKAAVATTMSRAEEMKKDGKLTEEQIKELNVRVYDLVMQSIPPSFIDEGNVLLKSIGGKEVLASIIKTLMEQYIYEYKKDSIK